MDLMTVIVGGLCFGYGLFNCVMRWVKPSIFRKLEPMKQRFGPQAGSLLHFIAYVVMPASLGIIILVQGLSGRSLGGLLNIFR